MATLDQDAAQAFQWADANGDGTITAAERSAAKTEHAEAEKEHQADPAKGRKLLR